MFIQTEETPNPATMKFLPGDDVITGSQPASFPDPAGASRSPLAMRLFAVQGVAGVFLGSDFISVTKSETKEWMHMKPAVLGAIMDHYASGDPVIHSDGGGAIEASEDDDEVVVQIKELLDTRVRPAVAQDGGDIIFHDFVDGVVYLEMHGACAGCPSSTATLKMGIENMLRYYVPAVVEVRPVF